MPLRTLRTRGDVANAVSEGLISPGNALNIIDTYIASHTPYMISLPERDTSGEYIEIGNIDNLTADLTNDVQTRVHAYDQACTGCGRPFSNDEAPSVWVEEHEGGPGLICDICQSNYYDNCAACHNPTHRSHAQELLGEADERIRYCGRCFDRIAHVHCGGCGENFNPGDPRMVSGNRCEACMAHLIESGEILYRKYKAEDFLTKGKKKGKTVRSLRPFGIELEAVWGSGKKVSKMSADLPPFVGVGQDASIQGGNGIEIQTPPASGEEAEKLIEAVCKTMSKASTVNQTCGYHLHVDVSDVDDFDAARQLHALKAVWLGYLCFEDVLLSFLPPSRKTNMRYCAPLRSEYSVDEIIRAENLDQLEQLWYRIKNKDQITRAKNEHHHASRYRGINLHPMFSGRHLEIRYHSGTLNATKILEWAQLHTGFIDFATKHTFDMGSFKAVMVEPNLAKKTAQLFDRTGLSEESRGYFLARQEMFRTKETAKTEDPHFKSGMKLLEAEKEI